ncbi:MAG: hypothetical protein IAC58_05825 [Firmicutes bacterium]|uniref:Uncharacterized protein n=1 Tax=Candidatus Onthovivens merdipullorum TaxID=2840889 RepID=A0A9D9DJV4_9BACL|nr:hypothetical protein [Candidatus Onthovivens merdipullorum]
MFIGRKNELKRLNNFYETDNFELIEIQAVRRIGKTVFLKESIKRTKIRNW